VKTRGFQSDLVRFDVPADEPQQTGPDSQNG
jgi:hypothetical protein